MSKPTKIACLLCVVIMLCGWIAFRVAGLLFAGDETSRGHCASNLTQLGLSLHLYASEHSGQYPCTLAVLMPKHGTDLDVFVCPDTGSKVGPIAELQKWMDYVYVAGLRSDDRPSIAQVIEKPGDHQGAGGNVLYAAGHVEWVADDGLRALLKEPWLKCPRRSGQKVGLSDDEIRDLQKRTGIGASRASFGGH